jgi:outer membrane protein TolC
MTADSTRIAALTAEIARLEASVASDGQAVQALRHDLDALRAALPATGDRGPDPAQPPDRPAARPGNPPVSPARDPGPDPDDDLFDDVPV